jgi:hypothetical protein
MKQIATYSNITREMPPFSSSFDKIGDKNNHVTQLLVITKMQLLRCTNVIFSAMEGAGSDHVPAAFSELFTGLVFFFSVKHSLHYQDGT